MLSCEKKEETRKTGTEAQDRLATFLVEAMESTTSMPTQNLAKPKTFSKQLGTFSKWKIK